MGYTYQSRVSAAESRRASFREGASPEDLDRAAHQSYVSQRGAEGRVAALEAQGRPGYKAAYHEGTQTWRISK